MSKQTFKQPVYFGMTAVLFAALFLSACGLSGTPAPSRAASTPAGNQPRIVQIATQPPAENPTKSQERVRQDVPPAAAAPTENPVEPQPDFTSPDFGFSLSYPKGYQVQQTYPHTFTLMTGQDERSARGWAYLEVERGLDQDALWYMNQARQDNAVLGVQLTSSMAVAGGQPAYILNRVPGQDLTRQVFIVDKGLLYHLTFIPDDPNQGEAYQQMETLYAAVMHSLRFLPEHKAVPPVLTVNNMIYQLERAFELRSEDEIVRLMGDEFVFINWVPKSPEGLASERFEKNEAARLILDKHLSQTPGLTLVNLWDWTSLMGEQFPFSGFFPGEVINTVLVKGWGPEGADQAAIIISHRPDGSLFWRGIIVAQGTF